MSKTINLIIIIVVAFASLVAVSPVSRGYAAGTAGADFLTIGAGARPTGMGEAFAAVADETSGMFYNPAGLGFSFSPEFQTMYSLWPGDLYYSFAGYTHPTLSGTYGLAFQYLSGAPIPKLADGVTQGDFSFYDGTANLLYAKRLSETVALGMNLKGIQSSLDTSSLSAFSGDCGFLFRTPDEGFSFGISGQNLFGKLGEDRLPLTARAGMAFKASLPEHYSDILFSLEAGQTQPGQTYYAAGIEHWGAGTLGIRVGYKYLADEKQRQAMDLLAPWRAGISVRVQSLALDYSYQPFAALGIAHRLSLTWRIFGWAAKWRMVPAQIKADPDIFSPNGDGGKDSVFFIPQVSEIKNIKRWELQIEDIGHNPVKKFSGKDVLPKILSWEGQADAGERIGEGKYFYYFIAEGDHRKRAKSNTGEIVADVTPPAASLQISNPVVSPDNNGLDDAATFYVSASDTHGIDQWRLSILNYRGKTVKVYKSTSSVPMEIVWDGTDDYYGMVVPNGGYEAQLLVWDSAGNKARASLPVKVNVPPKVEIKEVVKEIEVKQEGRGLVVNLSSQILFAAGKSNLRPEAYKALDEVVNLLQTYSENEVLIEGYTDSSGSRRKNIDLSSARAWAVYSYLVKKGVAPSRLKPKGFGPEKSVASNRTPFGRAQNRRVEIIILKK